MDLIILTKPVGKSGIGGSAMGGKGDIDGSEWR